MNIGIVGAKGRMGQMLLQVIDEHPDGTLAASGDVGESANVFENPDVQTVIDFTLPDATAKHAALASQHKKNLVIGTTGLNAEQDTAIDAAAKTVPIVYAPNYSLGINLLLGMVKKAAAVLPEDFQIVIDDVHHIHKKDSPSGTALGLARAAATGRDIPASAITINSRKEGEIVGTHVVDFEHAGQEILSLTHIAQDRKIFASGAVTAALWTNDKPPGLYTMKDVLGI